MITNRLLTLLSFLLITCMSGHAQQTGSFNAQISFMGQNRTLSCYVPANYNAGNSYKLMIGLHGLGDNSTNYRNVLINNRSWDTIFANTIFVFPDGGSDQNSDFYAPAGDEAIIDSAMAFAMSNYTIDTNYVVLQGFSLGGRSAIKFGLDYPAKFKGLLLNTPAFQGKRDVDNDPATSLVFNYANADQIPMYIAVGDQDIYYNILNPLIAILKKQNARLKYVPVANLGHSIPSSAVMSPSFPFFDNQLSPDFDVDIFDSEIPLHTCASSIAPICFVQNRGSATVSSIDIDYQFAGASGTYTWSGNLGAFESTQITLPNINTANGQQQLELSVNAINTNQQDPVLDNNQLADTVEVDLQSLSLPLSEGFESGAADWIINTSNSLFFWYTDSDVKKSGSNSIANFGTILYFYTMGNVEYFESPVLDLSGTASPVLTYDIAYNYHRFTPPYATVDTDLSDTLAVVISTDCGQSWQTLYKEGGAELATAQNPIINPVDLNSVFFNPTANEWRSDTLDLSAFTNATEAIIRFNYISGNGGSINLDNISLNGIGLSIQEQTDVSFEVFPNPADNQVSIKSQEVIESVELFNTSGQKVFSKSYEGLNQTELKLDVAHLSTGVYQLGIKTSKHQSYQQLVIK
jgi:predicted esterase